MYSCHDFPELETLVNDLIEEGLPPLQPRVHAHLIKNVDAIDQVAQNEISPDVPTHFKAVKTTGDGNCLCRATSKGYFNNESKHEELRCHIVIKGVKNKKYLNDQVLQCGATYTHKQATLPQVFGT